ncbi:P-loop containing nucleoside triphosphate hydrolase protein [Conidiobolus coronatus NRRL 28638]|uniref:p-loop containing nucleoside triphosphate hydrolase protein n=1 Tax=Conidiobolus coronatus (strain ATCC 28846 / CBS 209.66 / NRRL 28638) TaxID=796925 RepID=A0A137P5U0_CONC2|nr:P-loop containing nucleoside triphosphate hydrolase protein [Conidiobolus coronatus NRRL 28638]|eukprot:KXN70380.1 P-loop containing nucleoside triphosphate hydrolase protein [Conidiobolus coronatus NRRL 28638]
MSHNTEEEIDLILLQKSSPKSIAKCLTNRLNYGLPFTYLGENSLVVVNPSRDLGIFTRDFRDFYVQNGYKALEPSHQRLQPHIYEIITKAYFVMRRLGTDQSIIFSGASNSGKSVSYRESLRQLGQLSLNPKKPSKIPEQLDHILDIVQSFTHCSTSSNSTSSRLGLYQECQFTNRGRLAGIKTIPYYFDKFRLTNIPQNESNFHILYHLVEVATPEERSAYGLNTNFNYLPTSIYYKQNNYLNIQESLKQVNFKAKSRAKINQILAAILHLGNLEFVSAGEGQEIYISNVNTLDLIANLLGLDSNDLFSVLIQKTQYIGKELCTTLLDIKAADHEKDRLAIL